MVLLIPIEEFEVSSFNEFCEIFKIKTKLIAGDDGTDEELIQEE